MHINRERRDRYLTAMITNDFSCFQEEQLFELESHLNDCDDCALALHDEYEFYLKLEKWSIRVDNVLLLKNRILAGLESELTTITDDYRKLRLKNWIATFFGHSQGLLKIALQAKKMGRRLYNQINFEPLEKAFTSANRLSFAYDTLLEPVRGSSDEKTLSNLTKVLSTNSPETISVYLSPETQSLMIEIENKGQQWLPYVLIIPTDGTQNLRVQNSNYRACDHHFVYEFTDLPPGEYLLLFEPAKELDADTVAKSGESL